MVQMRRSSRAWYLSDDDVREGDGTYFLVLKKCFLPCTDLCSADHLCKTVNVQKTRKRKKWRKIIFKIQTKKNFQNQMKGFEKEEKKPHIFPDNMISDKK